MVLFSSRGKLCVTFSLVAGDDPVQRATLHSISYRPGSLGRTRDTHDASLDSRRFSSLPGW